ncbi:C1 family peptidase [Amycolatopsis alkalitolerans]|uniref:Peptidase C1 n=1 Tax=Amycolatopsis alkalitolerans TaxID=2547244 RepID=A0A5C4M5E7_9PSEU|nr:C1 family peptidase [Amycolatopsis alkalitolerans]TNC28485.1 peptidase C1 [Amycolatopsis alkalitolerans]
MSSARSCEEEIAAIRDSLATLGDPWQAGETGLSRLGGPSRAVRLGVPAPSAAAVEARVDLPGRMAEAALGTAGQRCTAEYAPTGELPRSFDLRRTRDGDYTTPVKDQGERGSCTAFGVVAVLEGTAAYLRRVAGLDLDLSEAHLYFGQADLGEDGTWPDDLLGDCVSNGVTFEDYWPYTDVGAGSLNPDWRNRFVRAGKVVDLTRDPAGIKHHIYGYGPVTTCMVVYEDFFHYTGGVYRHTTEETNGGHCVALVGWDDDQGCWIAKNSWGTGWGEAGFFRIAYGESYVEDYPEERPTTLGCTGIALRAWLPAQRALSLFASAQDAGGWAYLENLGWTRLAGGTSGAHQLALLADARAGGHPVIPFVVNDELLMVQTNY